MDESTLYYDVRAKLYEVINKLEKRDTYDSDEFLQGIVCGLYRATNILRNPNEERYD